MAEYSYRNELIDNYVSEFQSRIVSETGIESDKYHLGKMILRSLKDDPDFVMQIDGGTGESETNKSMLKRSIQCANSLKHMGIKTGDAIVLMAPNHLDLAVPLYAALYLGIATAAIDRTLVVNELKNTFDNIKPKVIFCQSEKVQDVRKAVDLLGLDSKIISFDKSQDTISLSEMMEKHGGETDVENFKPTDFDPDETTAYLVATSGTTGLPKCTILSHKNMMTTAPATSSYATKLPPTQSVFIVSPLQWLTAILNYLMAPFYKYTRIQSSHALTMEHILEVIRKYKPTFMIISPTFMTPILKAAKRENCDLSCFETLLLGGSAVPKTLVDEIKNWTPNTLVADAYGMSEVGSIIFHSVDSPLGSCGVPFAHLQYKLMNIETGEEIKEPNKRGELWIKTPGGFKGYYNNPEATAEARSKDGWFMTGDMLYRDENWNFYYVERIKLLLKYMNHQISPVELEGVIRQHPAVLDVAVTSLPDPECGDLPVACVIPRPGANVTAEEIQDLVKVELEGVIRQHPAVLDVAVTSLPDPECGDLPVACVIPRPGANVTAEEIQDLVKEKLTDTKQLRGGVIFLQELPLTSSTKVHRRKLKEMVMARAAVKSS